MGLVDNNGNGRIDPQDIATSAAVEMAIRDKGSDQKSGANRSENALFESVFGA